MKKFIEQLIDKDYPSKDSLKYNAGCVSGSYAGRYAVSGYQEGARKTFSIGQPVYDKDRNLMGWLGVGLFESLDYSLTGIDYPNKDLRVPVECWEIFMATPDCENGKKVYTYWQTYNMTKEGAVI